MLLLHPYFTPQGIQAPAVRHGTVSLVLGKSSSPPHALSPLPPFYVTLSSVKPPVDPSAIKRKTLQQRKSNKKTKLEQKYL